MHQLLSLVKPMSTGRFQTLYVKTKFLLYFSDCGLLRSLTGSDKSCYESFVFVRDI